MVKKKQLKLGERTPHPSEIPSIAHLEQHRSSHDANVLDTKQQSPSIMNPKRKRRRRFHKESPVVLSPKHSKKDEHGKNRVVDTLLSLQQLKEPEREGGKKMGEHKAERHGSGRKRLYTGKNITSFSELETLRNYIEGLGGIFEDGWHIDVQRSLNTGKLSKSFISPHNERFRSRIEVARHLGLNPTRVGTAHLLARSTVQIESQDKEMDDDDTLQIQTLEDHENQLYDGGGSLLSHEECKKDYSTTKAENRAVHVNSNSIKPSEGMATSSEAIRAVVMAPSAALVTQRCEETLRSIICTDKFAALSKMFNQSTPSGSLEGVLQLKSPPLVAGSLDLQLIHLRLSTGAYGRSPQLFYGDIQQVWANIISAGNELIKLSQSLLDFSNNLYKQQVMTLFQAPPGERAPPMSISLPDQKLAENHAESSNLHLHKQSIDCNGMSFDDSQISQEHHLVQPSYPNSRLRVAEEAVPPELGSPRPNGVVVSGKSLIYPTSANSPELKVYVKKFNGKSRKSKGKIHTNDKDRLSTIPAPILCNNCGLERSEDWIVCEKCNAGFHVHCVDFALNEVLPDNQWCCPECIMKNVVEHSSELGHDKEVVFEEIRQESCVLDSDVMNKSGRTLKISGKPHGGGAYKKVDNNVLLSNGCETGYCMARMNTSILSKPEEFRNCSVYDRISNDSICPLLKETIKHASFNEASIGRIMKKTLLKHSNLRSPDHGIDHASIKPLNHRAPEHDGANVSIDHLNHGSPEHGIEHGSIERLMECGIETDDFEHRSPSVENVSPDHAFLIENENENENKNENACKICGVENKRPCVSCAGCPRRYHLSCLQPALKRVPRKTWFCPSCLCRACKIDADDDQILLCDGCDEGYHTYCLNPPLPEIPEGTWFCPTCAGFKNTALNSPSKVDVLKRKRKSTEPRRSI